MNGELLTNRINLIVRTTNYWTRHIKHRKSIGQRLFFLSSRAFANISVNAFNTEHAKKHKLDGKKELFCTMHHQHEQRKRKGPRTSLTIRKPFRMLENNSNPRWHLPSIQQRLGLSEIIQKDPHSNATVPSKGASNFFSRDVNMEDEALKPTHLQGQVSY